MKLGEKIQQLRKAMGLSQEQLAEMVGVSRQAISKWETNQSYPDIDKLSVLCKVFSVSADELLGNEPNPEQKNIQKLHDFTSANFVKRSLTIGWVTTLVGIVMLIIEFFSLYFLQKRELELYSRFSNNVLSYAKEPPMSIIFIITFVLIFVGIIMLVYSYELYKQHIKK